MKKILSLVLVLVLSAALLVGCAAPSQTAAVPQAPVAEEAVTSEPAVQVAEEPKLTGGVLCVKINPEIAVYYDENGKVTKLEGRNADGLRILKGYTGYEGQDTAQVLEELVDIIGKAGYFVEEADGNARRIVLELDPGSQVPHEQFLQDMAAHVKACVESKSWVGEREYDYDEKPVQETAPASTTAPAVTVCPVCADDDCDEGKYCDDADELAENLREAENRKNGITCPVCGDYDCDDGIYCDDWDDRYDNDHDDHHDDHHDHDDWDD